MGRSFEGRDGAKMGRLSNALVQALEWQNTKIEDTKLIKENNHVYYGPHKWIVCLLGSDDYTVRDFIEFHEKKIKKNRNEKSNLTISVLGLSGQEFKLHAQDYKEISELTKRGNFLNIVNKGEVKNQQAADKFFSAMDVYPSEQIPVVKELFQNI